MGGAGGINTNQSHNGDEMDSSHRRHIQSSRRTFIPLAGITFIAVCRLAKDLNFCGFHCRTLFSGRVDPTLAGSLAPTIHAAKRPFISNLPPEIVSQDVIVNGHSYSLEDKELLPSLPLPKPVIVVGMPKAGTTTIHSFFQDAGYKSSHYRCKEDQGIRNLFCGHCIRDAIQNNLPPLKTCGDYEVWAQLDVTYYPFLNIPDCYFPQFFDMETFHQEAPNATIIFNRRDLDHWSRSIQMWKNMSERLTTCAGGPASGSTEDLQQWHKNHIQKIRRFVQKHPSHALVEIDIEDPMTAKRMATLFQVSEDFWGHKNINHKTTATTTTVAAQSSWSLPGQASTAVANAAAR